MAYWKPRPRPEALPRQPKAVPESNGNPQTSGRSLGAMVGTSGLMGLKMNEYGRRLSVVEINHTFHDVQPRRENLQALESQLRAAGLRCIIKVSRLATHENKLKDPELWWKSIWNCYKVLHDAGLLLGLLWQLPPSFAATDDNIYVLDHLLAHIKSVDGTQTRHVFDFRHSGWYRIHGVHRIMRQHNACLAWLHLQNDASRWAGDLHSGWSTWAKTADFVYFRLFGSKGRSIGRYSDHFLAEEIVKWLPNGDCFIIFGQGDVPMHALENAQSTLALLRGTLEIDPAPPDLVEDSENSPCSNVVVDEPGLVSATIQHVTDGCLYVELGDGREAVLGTRHLKHANLSANMSRGKRQGRRRFHIGEQITGLQIEGVDPETKQVFLRAGGVYEDHKGQKEERTGLDDSEDPDTDEEQVSGMLPSAIELGVDPARVLKIITWGNSKMRAAPDAQLHVTCNYKKFHYLTRNNKHIKWLNGLDGEVKDQVRKSAFLESWLRDTVPSIETQKVDSVALHCYKGTHLSVAIAELMRELYYPKATVQHLSLKAERAGHVGGPARH